jgi:hypothetical protein
MLRDPRKEEPHNDNHCICAVRYLLDVQSSGTQYTPPPPHTHTHTQSINDSSIACSPWP